MTRRKNPEPSVIVGVGLGALAVGLLGWLGYKMVSSQGMGAALSGNPLDALPAFEPHGTADDNSVYILIVYTKAPLHITTLGTGQPGQQVRTVLETLPSPVDHLSAMGPFTKDSFKGHPPPIPTPVPDLILVVNREGILLEGMTREQAEAMKALTSQAGTAIPPGS